MFTVTMLIYTTNDAYLFLRFNSIRASPVYGFKREEGAEGGITLQCFKNRDTFEECMMFWGHATPKHVN